MNRLSRKWQSFKRLPLRVRAALPLAWLMLGLARLAIVALPFDVVRRWLGGHHDVAPWLHRLRPEQTRAARDVGQLVRLAARYTPWTANCLPQALVARSLLIMARQPHTVFFGLRRESSGLMAHAWVASGMVVVTGGYGFGHYTVVGCVAWPPLESASR